MEAKKVLSTLLRPRLPGRWVRQAKDDFRELKTDIEGAIQQPVLGEHDWASLPPGDAWDTLMQEMVKREGNMAAVEQSLRLQVSQRRFQAGLMAGFMTGGAAWMLLAHNLIDFLGGTAIFSAGFAFYLSHIFHLYQIRERALVTLGDYLRAAFRDPGVLIPLGLPEGWKAVRV